MIDKLLKGAVRFLWPAAWSGEGKDCPSRQVQIMMESIRCEDCKSDSYDNRTGTADIFYAGV